jgi:hypothetical protein
MKFGAKKKPTVIAGGSRFAPNFIQNLYTVLKKRLWESRSTPTLGEILNFKFVYFLICTVVDASALYVQ